MGDCQHSPHFVKGCKHCEREDLNDKAGCAIVLLAFIGGLALLIWGL